MGSRKFMGSISLVKKGAIYLYNNNDIVWVGEEYHGDFLDRHFRGQYYTRDEVLKYFKREITLKEAVSLNLVSYSRFTRMGKADKVDTIKMMLEVKGLLETLDFLSQTELGLSKEYLESILNSK